MSSPETNYRPDVPVTPDERRQWRHVTGAVIHDLPDNPELQNTLIDLIAEPVSQTLPGEALTAMTEVDGRVADLAEDYETTLGDFVHQEPIPEAAIGPDLGHSDLPKETVLMVGELTREARELKILGLMAELHRVGGPKYDENGDFMLPSGVHMHIDPEQPISAGPLMNPANYEKRNVIKDRVSIVTVAGQPYIMKERKTGRHTDTLENGHKDGLTSAQEFVLGRDLHDKGESKDGRVHIQWENPLGYVEFPDGYQFMISAFEPDLIDKPKEALRQLEEAIKAEDNRMSFEAEYQAIVAQHPQLTYDRFAILMANRLMDQAEDLYDGTLADRKLKRRDLKRGLSFRINTDEGLTLEAFGYDLEYLKPVETAAEAQPATISTDEQFPMSA